MADERHRIVPNIWAQGNAEEMGEFYAASLPDTTSKVESRYPTEGLLDFQQPFAGKPLTVAVEVAGTRLVLINAGDEFRPNPAISFMLNFDAGDREVLDRTWAALSDSGTVRMELDTYDFSSRYGWLEDRYGVNWQLMLAEPGGDPRPFVVPALMYGGAVQDKAAEAAEFYAALFADTPGGTEIGNRWPYGTPTGPASAEALAYGEFRIGDQWFVASDFGADHAFAFTEAVSLEVSGDDQAEIDRLWDALSSVPEAEQCGWCKDRYGVSWQVVPANMGELMQHPGAFEKMLAMKKIVVADL